MCLFVLLWLVCVCVRVHLRVCVRSFSYGARRRFHFSIRPLHVHKCSSASVNSCIEDAMEI